MDDNDNQRAVEIAGMVERKNNRDRSQEMVICKMNIKLAMGNKKQTFLRLLNYAKIETIHQRILIVQTSWT